MTKICGVLILATVVLSTVNITESIQTILPSNLQNVLRKYGKQSKFLDVEDALRAKVAKLMPLLDDNKGNIKESNENDINWDHDNIGNRNFNTVNQRYKKLRKEIEKLLKIEPVSENTRKTVMNALDEITADLMSNECLWKKNIEGNEDFRTTDQTKLIMKHIQQKWNKIYNQYYLKYIGYNDTARKTFAILKGLRNFIFDIHEEYKNLENRYPIKCDIVTYKKKEATRTVQGQDSECHIKICSAEILNFIMVFFKQVRKTYSDVFNNYVKMYQKEVKHDERRGYSREDSFENHMNHLEDDINKKMENSLLQAVEPLEFTVNYTLSTTDVVKHFINKTIHNVLTQIDKSISRQLKSLPSKLRLTVREDLKTTASIELGNLKQKMTNKICTVFRTCNGVATWRKYNKRNDDFFDPNRIHLKLKLGFDKDPIKGIFNLLGRKVNSVFNGHEKDAPKLQDSNNQARKDFGYVLNQTQVAFNVSKHNHLNVTRTTLEQYFERGTTEISSLVTTDAIVLQFR